MYESYVAERITQLRTEMDVSAREVSLAIGQNENYINHIENKKSMPSIVALFYICEYFKITPEQFFQSEIRNPSLINSINHELNNLDKDQQESIYKIVKSMNSK